MGRNLVYILIFIIIAWSDSAVGQDMETPVDTQMKLIMKILTFDRSLAAQAEEKIVFGILYQSRFKQSFNASEDIKRNIGENKLDNFEGITLEWKFIDLQSISDLRDAITSAKLSAVYIAPLRAVDIIKIIELCRRNNINTFTGVPDYMNKGIAVGIGLRNNKPEIIINLSAAKAEHSDYSSQLLKLCRIIEDTEKK